MIHPKLRILVALFGVTTPMLVAPPESKAIFHWFRRGGCCPAPVTTYQPVVVAQPICNPCAPQVVQYMPQTCYRPQCVSVPVTTFRPVIAADPCTGCPVTAMRPVTVMRQQVQYVPYTTYRIVSTPAVATTVASPVVAPAAPAACCTPTSAAMPATTYSAPAMPAPGYATPTPTPTPSLAPTPGTPDIPRTYDNGSANGGDARMRPIEDPNYNNGNGANQYQNHDNRSNGNNSNHGNENNNYPQNGVNGANYGEPSSGPQLNLPGSGAKRTWDRTATNYGATTERTASYAAPAATPIRQAIISTPVDDGGWRASER